MADITIRRLLSLERLLARPVGVGAPLTALVLGHALPADASRILARCDSVIAADSGADRLQELPNAPHPSVVIGDLDSISEKARSYYADHGIRLIDLSHDQVGGVGKAKAGWKIAGATSKPCNPFPHHTPRNPPT